ncbi:response regulator [Engelhardtia mirabilis]|uniref:Chemotaxis protein CheY n=1 Tax=Engelhardtia mirabilis TaxID=2528011 RepID=A0A518BFE5_9BACT|nr:Chemotaxis protein CheY [Planctomycetes bacterium Pla133]QDV00033.1 Chemotaxis protein CheY [Planctomycetes bacterium Pla86]
MIPTRRILLADDDNALRAGVADLLLELGLEVVEAQTGLEAVEQARTRRVHAALLDLHMPECTGLEAIPLLHLAHVGLPCIVYSGALTAGLELAARQAGAFAVLSKPVNPTLLRSEILRALESGRHSQGG